MMQKENPFSSVDSDVTDVLEISESIYNQYFEKYFRKMKYWHSKYSDSPDSAIKMTDDEMESALSDLPLEMFGVSEELSNFKLRQGIIKLKIKEFELKSKIEADPDLEYNKLLQMICTTLIARVEHEISFSREFIMVMKKIWDSRRATDQASPISKNVVPDLPEYDISDPHIKF